MIVILLVALRDQPKNSLQSTSPWRGAPAQDPQNGAEKILVGVDEVVIDIC
jgi:hypothetical protein